VHFPGSKTLPGAKIHFLQPRMNLNGKLDRLTERFSRFYGAFERAAEMAEMCRPSSA